MKNQKQQERVHLEALRRVYPDFPDGVIENSEEPDFLVDTPRGHLGIEHTEIFRPKPPGGLPLQAQESLRQRVVDEARKHRAAGDDDVPLQVGVVFNDSPQLTKARVYTVAEELAEAIAGVSLPAGEGITLDGDEDRGPSLPDEIYAVRVYRPQGPSLAHWLALDAQFEAKITPEHLQGIINKKEQRLRSYQDRCVSVWLLIVADGSQLSGTLDLPDAVRAHVYHSRFERVIYFEIFERRWTQLNTCYG